MSNEPGVGRLLGDFEEIAGDQKDDPTTFLAITSRNVLRVLLQDWDVDTWPTSVFSGKFFKLLCSQRKMITRVGFALEGARDPELLAALRDSLEHLLIAIGEQNFQADDLNDRRALAIANLLSLYVMFEPEDEKEITIPCHDAHGGIVNSQYTIKRIELTPQQGIMAKYIKDKDRVYSYGFKSHNGEFNSLLVHCGTGWGTAQGIEIQALTNHWVGKTPGEKLYQWGKERLNAWMDDQRAVHAIGHSLGGSLAYFTADDRPDKVVRVDALNPPGRFNKVSSLPGKHQCDIVIQRTKHDVVNALGFYDPGMRLLNVSPRTIGPSWPFRALVSHLRNGAANDEVELKAAEPSSFNQSFSRELLNQIVCFYRGVKFIPMAISFFVVSPIWNVIKNPTRSDSCLQKIWAFPFALVEFAVSTVVGLAMKAIMLVTLPVTTLLFAVTGGLSRVFSACSDSVCLNKLGLFKPSDDQEEGVTRRLNPSPQRRNAP